MKPFTLSLEGLNILTDETGMFQHTTFSIVNRKEGYATDDNARALISTLMFYKIINNQDSLRLANTYLSFLLHMQRSDGRFHNFLGFDRSFQDVVGSEDSNGRALWASGYALSSHAPEDMKNVAKQIFDRGLPNSHNFTSPRAEAFTILGLYHYNKAFPDDLNILDHIRLLARKLVDRYHIEADDKWRWFEPYLTYSNSRMSQALFTAYEVLGEPEYVQVATSSMDFLIETHMIEDMFVPIGTKNWYKKNGIRSKYDQQPIEASCMIDAAYTAFNSTDDEKYKKIAQIIFEWYHGRNTNNVVLYNQKTSTCYDGITREGLNKNQGAEATLSYYLSYLKLREMNQ